MQCPAADAELISHTTQGENGLTVSYSTCPACRGYWMDSFAANFIKITSVDATTPTASASPSHCPICTKALTRSNGDNIPNDICVYDCPANHGYFFPTGQLAAFKKAQQTKIAYHKLWHIAMPNVRNILLASIVLLLLSGALAITFRGVQQQQNNQLQAKEILLDHAVYPTTDQTTLLVSATTATDASLTVHIPSRNGFVAPMYTRDNRTHQLTIQNVPAGTYGYFFAIDVSGKNIKSDTFTFTIRAQ